MPPTFIAIADTHCRFDVLEQVIEAEKDACAVLHCGDLGLYDAARVVCLPAKERTLIRKHKNPIEQFKAYLDGVKRLPLPVYAVAGNHEDFVLVKELERGERHVANLTMLLPGERAPIADTSCHVMGLGGILPVEMSERRRKQDKIIQPDGLAKMLAGGRGCAPDILLLHDTPRLKKETGGEIGHPSLTELIQTLRPPLVFTGHIHREFRVTLGDSRICGLGYGASGRYALVDGAGHVEFKRLGGYPVTPLDFAQAPVTESEVGSPAKRRPRPPLVLSPKKILAHFQLDAREPAVLKCVQEVSRRLRLLQNADQTLSQKEALAMAEKHLNDSGLL